MKQIETGSRYDYTPLFDALIDKEKLICETVGRDEFGNLILHVSAACNMSSAYSSREEYFLLTPEEYGAYLQKARGNKLVSWLAARRLAREAEVPVPAKGRIVSFEIVTLHISGMRGAYEYEILPKEDKAEVSQYSIRYVEGEDQRVLAQRAHCDKERMLGLLNDCNFLSWDGFYGSHPKGVLDGIMFTLTATVNGDRTVKANGSQNFPRHYRDFTDALYEILKEGEKFD